MSENQATPRTRHGQSNTAIAGPICVGSSVAIQCGNFQSHPLGRLIRAANNNSTKINPPQAWDACWKCKRAMGCPACVPNPICRQCLVVTDMEFFIEQGPLSNDSFSIAARGDRRGPPISVYPSDWAREYFLAHPDTATTEDEELYQTYKRLEARIKAKVKMPHDPARSQLERERNAQVRELASE